MNITTEKYKRSVTRIRARLATLKTCADLIGTLTITGKLPAVLAAQTARLAKRGVIALPAIGKFANAPAH